MPQFPENPQVGDIVQIPITEEHGVITQIRINEGVGDEEKYGEVQALSRIPTSERKYLLKNVIFSVELVEGQEIHLTVRHFPIDSYIFLEDCGWTPKDLGEPITAFNRKGVVLRKPVLTLSCGFHYNVYNEVSVDLPPQDKKEKEDEQP